MNVLVDSSVWSLALRRNTKNDAIALRKKERSPNKMEARY
ncbi:hypothetical protein OSCI_3460019 [Kamptonema sp. PCC 6506]|nr:hypothetical protein OSCI_3460019 [Kamptonema sp. PCC 6506]